jgi:hypothetical protein
MKKAQWKADPRTRAFGMDPRELRIRELEGELHALKEANELWRYKAQHYQNEVNTREDKMGQLYQYRAAYKVLALTGVVLEHEGEFKHLKGDDMHEFFGIKAFHFFLCKANCNAYLLCIVKTQSIHLLTQ